MQQIVANGFVLLGAEVELVIDDVSAKQIEGEVDFASGGLAMAIAMTWKVISIALGKADEGGILDEDAIERTAWKAVGGRAIALAQMDQALDEEAFDTAFGAIDSLVQSLRADLISRRVLAEGADELVDRSPPGGDRIEQGEEKILRAKSPADPLHEARFFGEAIEF